MSESTMSECQICGRVKAEAFVSPPSDLCDLRWTLSREEHYRLGYERTLARADRYEAEFSACKALLIAEQKRAERAEAERAAAERDRDNFARQAGEWQVFANEQEGRASEARAALERAREECALTERPPAKRIATLREILDLAIGRAALPVEPARRQVTEITQMDGDTPSAPGSAELAELRKYKDGAQAAWKATADGECRGCGGTRNWSLNGQVQAYCVACDDAFEGTRKQERRPALEAVAQMLRDKAAAEDAAELARCSDQPAPLNPPPSPTGDT